MASSHYVNLESRGYFPISATSSTAIALSASITAASAASATRPIPNYALIIAETQAIRWRDDGTAPTAAISGGMPLAVGTPMEYDGEINKFQFISQAGTATVNVTLYNAS